MLPKAQYRRKSLKEEETIVGNFFKEGEGKSKVCEETLEKEEDKPKSQANKFRVRSMY